MKDKLGKYLLNIRINNVLPFIKEKMIDIGCGTNELVRTYKSISNKEAIGVDVYPWEGVDLTVENTANLPFSDKEFDTVCCIATLNHIPNRKDVIKEMKRILKDDGQIIITMITPKISRIWHFLRKPWDVDQKERGMKEGEVYGFTKKQIISLFKEENLYLEKMKKFMFGLNRIYIFKKYQN